MAKKQKYRRNFFSIRSLVCLIICIVLLLIAYAILLGARFVLNGADNVSSESVIVVDIFSNVLLVIISVLGSSIFSSFLIERKELDKQSIETILNDVLCSTEYLPLISDRNKGLLEAGLLGFDCQMQGAMIRAVCSKLFEDNPEYYFEECEYTVNCKIGEKYIEKEITRSSTIRSYAKTCKINGYVFVKMTSKPLSCGEDCLTVTKVEINNKRIDSNKYRPSPPRRVNASLLEKNGYTMEHCYAYKDTLLLKNDESTKIVVTYKTRVEKDDTHYCCRVSEHCNKFSVHFQIDDQRDYKIVTSPFGFMDTAYNSPNDNSRNKVDLVFNGLVFKECGVAIDFKEKNP